MLLRDSLPGSGSRKRAAFSLPSLTPCSAAPSVPISSICPFLASPKRNGITNRRPLTDSVCLLTKKRSFDIAHPAAASQVYYRTTVKPASRGGYRKMKRPPLLCAMQQLTSKLTQAALRGLPVEKVAAPIFQPMLQNMVLLA